LPFFFGVFLVKEAKLSSRTRIHQAGIRTVFAVSPDEKYLDIGEAEEKSCVYDIQANDLATNGRVLARGKYRRYEKADQKGNLYLTTGMYWIVSPEGKRLGEIWLPGEPGGNRALTSGSATRTRRPFFIAAQSKLYSCFD